jgi:hypothetical protein
VRISERILLIAAERELSTELSTDIGGVPGGRAGLPSPGILPLWWVSSLIDRVGMEEASVRYASRTG